MMDSDEDDIYPDQDDVYGNQHHPEVKMEDADYGEEEGEEVEEDDEDDVDFIIDAKDEPKAKPSQNSNTASPAKRPPGISQSSTSDIRKTSATSATPSLAVKRETPLDARAGSQPPNDRPGTDYPARHTSKIDPNGNPVHPTTGKPILSTDFDVDFPSESSKPWRKPGADVTDFFNYGFDEFTWASYCLKQQTMPKEVKEITQQAEQMKAFVEGIPGGGAGGMPGMPTMPGSAPGGAGAGDMAAQSGMPNEAQMQQMFAAMMSQGMDPSGMDPSQFMQFMSGPGAAMMGGPQPPTGPAAGFQGQGGGGAGFDQGGGGGGPGGGGGGGGFGGRGRGKGGRRNW